MGIHCLRNNMSFQKTLFVLAVLTVILMAEAGGDRQPEGGKKEGRPAKSKSKFFDDSCLPDCDGLGFAMLVASDAACPSNMTLEQLEKEGVAKKDFCKPENSKVCTYCVKIEYKVNQASCEMTKPETCDNPKDLKNGQCMCVQSRYYGYGYGRGYGYGGYGYGGYGGYGRGYYRG